MENLQRSTTSFRRQGSSGLVWENDKAVSGELNQIKVNNQENKESRGSSDSMMRRNRSDGGGGQHMYRTMKTASPNVDPPSPKVSGCGFCGAFGKPAAVKKRRSPNKRKS